LLNSAAAALAEPTARTAQAMRTIPMRSRAIEVTPDGDDDALATTTGW
jgi:hypothetical protein